MRRVSIRHFEFYSFAYLEIRHFAGHETKSPIRHPEIYGVSCGDIHHLEAYSKKPDSVVAARRRDSSRCFKLYGVAGGSIRHFGDSEKRPPA